ncbi:MAG TPA: hypothetical protein VII52_10805, partial [Gemmatimonadaceae bacterium]
MQRRPTVHLIARASLQAFAVASIAPLAFHAISAAQAPATPMAPMAPVNALPNPYRTIEGWATLPDGRTWGSTSAVAIDNNGTSVWVAERCGANSCVGSSLDPVLE